MGASSVIIEGLKSSDGQPKKIAVDDTGQVKIAGTVSIGSIDTEVQTKDYDTGAGVDTQGVVGILLPASGGAVAGGTSTNPIRTDPTGTTAQPVTDSEKIADNTAFTDGTTKVQPAGYIFDEVAGAALTENDAVAARVDSKRAQVYVIEDATTRGRRATVQSTGELATMPQGTVASGSTDSSNPIKIGGRYNSTKPTFTDGQRGDAQIDTRGSQIVSLSLPDALAVTSQAAGADGVSNTFNAYLEAALGYLFNGTTFDRARGTARSNLFSSAARTATTNSADQTGYNHRGVLVIMNITVEAAAETLSLKIQGKEIQGNNYFDIVDFGVIYNAATDAPTATRGFFMYPGLVDADFVGITGNGSLGKNGVLPRTFRIVITHSASGSWTYSADMVLLP